MKILNIKICIAEIIGDTVLRNSYNETIRTLSEECYKVLERNIFHDPNRFTLSRLRNTIKNEIKNEKYGI